MLTPAAAITDPALLGPYFEGSSWDTWRAVLKAACAEPLDAEALRLFKSVAGDRDPPTRRVRELIVVAGRRSGKDSIASAVCTAAALQDYAPHLRPGERASVLCLAVDREQAKIVNRYVAGYFRENPLLQPLVSRETDDGLELTNNVEVIVTTNSYRSVRGRTVACAVFDEVAFWRDADSANPDTETYNAVAPGLVTLPGAMLIMITSAYRRSGLAFEKWSKSFGQNDPDVLVIYGPSTAFNPTLPQAVIDAALARDPEAAGAEWLSQWRSDIADFLDRELVEAAVDRGVAARPPQSGVRYVAFADPSGGRGDSFAVAVGHADGGAVVLDAIYERRAPFDPSSAVREIADLLRGYGIAEVTGDRYAAGWTVEGFAKEGVGYRQSERDRSALYLDALPLFTAGRARLLDHQRLVHQFCALERRTSRSGRDRIDHAPGAHDDLANAAAGALTLAAAGAAPPLIRAADLLTPNGVPVALPPICDAVLATLAVDPLGHAAAIFWARSQVGVPLMLLDFETAPLGEALFSAIGQQLVDLARRCGHRAATQPAIFTVETLAAQALARGLAAVPIDEIASADPTALALSAAGFVAAGAVKIAQPAHDRARRHPLGAALDFRADGRADDPLRLAALVGIVVSLDERDWAA